MKTRIITAAAALALFIIILLLPPVVFTIALAAVIFLMLYECYTATKADTAMKVVGFISATMMMCGVYMYVSDMFSAYRRIVAPGVMMTIILIYMTLVIFQHGKKNYKDILASGLLTMYLVLSTSCIWLLKEKSGTEIMLLIFICAWSTDTFAYFSGRFFGKRKLIPNVSPNKTVAGAMGGVLGAMSVCVLYLFIITKILGLNPEVLKAPLLGFIPTASNTIVQVNLYWTPICVFFGLIVGLVGGVCSQLGDLTASAIKRDTEIKDFGWIFPGHGGFMDRFDSVVFIAPIIYGIWILLTIYMTP
ncbi:MAG: phosphatidate cytidylyltransferase [Oscillospiraceae bacterium]|nr:phosphatidate cytidylyltransferase [Oscillospiraceae bacterium]